MRQRRFRNRRRFLCDTFSVAAGYSIAGAFSSFANRNCSSAPASRHDSPPVEVEDESTGLPLLRLPEGFRYVSFGWKGDPLKDGTPTPAAHDGMAVVSEKNGIVTIVRNHEINVNREPIPVETSPFDSKVGGGCTTFTFDCRTGTYLEAWASLSGTVRNCAGGVTPWNTWLSCEESVLEPGDIFEDKPLEIEREHGWVFEVPAEGCAEPIPLRDMGRFVHEALCVDRTTGIVYQTEDRGTSGFYRFLPNRPGRLAEGGSLQMLRVKGHTNLRGHVANGACFETDWVDIDDPYRAHSSEDSRDSAGVLNQGLDQEGTAFARLEGCWFGDGCVYFDATSGGIAQVGQIWKYDPSTQRLTMLFESPDASILNMPDNLCCHPRGGLFICEDSDYGKFAQQRVHYLDGHGRLRLFGINNVQLDGERNGITGDFLGREWAGATFSPDGEWLFVNIQTPGITFAITGPWDEFMS